ncbi:MAG: PD40 domain-containing protein [Candidatus Marinimicrobia bacterium]|nr:PD40 domain-containing protein [Candidatus Neomarinimicrobiota bacterium]
MNINHFQNRYFPGLIILSLFFSGCEIDHTTGSFTPPPIEGDIVFVSRRTPDRSDWSLFRMEADGSNQQQLVDMPVRCAPPVPSPDGSKVLFIANDQSHDYELYLLDMDTQSLLLLATGERYCGAAAWAPDGSQIAFVRNRAADTDDKDILLIDPEGNGLQALTSSGNNSCPAWAPDGAQIAYCSDGRISVMNSDGSGKLPLTDSTLRAGRPIWSPDGSQILFTGMRAWEDGSQIFIMNADGSGLIQLTDTVNPHHWDTGFPRGGNEQPAWSPYGNRIVYVSWEDGDAEVFIMNRDGTGKTQLTNADRRDESPSWSPAGEAIVFSSRRYMSSDYEIFLMAPDGSNQVAVSNYYREDSFPVWLPTP